MIAYSNTASTDNPTQVPASEPSSVPTKVPTNLPTYVPTNVPTSDPSAEPTGMPTVVPTSVPVKLPTMSPTQAYATTQELDVDLESTTPPSQRKNLTMEAMENESNDGNDSIDWEDATLHVIIIGTSVLTSFLCLVLFCAIVTLLVRLKKAEAKNIEMEFENRMFKNVNDKNIELSPLTAGNVELQLHRRAQGVGLVNSKVAMVQDSLQVGIATGSDMHMVANSKNVNKNVVALKMKQKSNDTDIDDLFLVNENENGDNNYLQTGKITADENRVDTNYKDVIQAFEASENDNNASKNGETTPIDREGGK